MSLVTVILQVIALDYYVKRLFYVVVNYFV